MPDHFERPGVTVTDYRGTEQELWDEDPPDDDDRKTLVIAPRKAHLGALLRAPALASAASSTKTEAGSGAEAANSASSIGAGAHVLQPSADAAAGSAEAPPAVADAANEDRPTLESGAADTSGRATVEVTDDMRVSAEPFTPPDDQLAESDNGDDVEDEATLVHRLALTPGTLPETLEAPKTDPAKKQGAAAPARKTTLTGVGPTATMVHDVARFISEPGQLRSNPERELDAPRRSLAALELLDAEDANADLHATASPPALPLDVKPQGAKASSEGSSPSLSLVPAASSTRAEATERTTSIPRTHPLANSLAPGASAMSTRPPVKRSSRWQVALGVAALLAIGGTSRLLQSRGEHHAASGRLPAQDEEPRADARRAPAAPEPAASQSEEAAPNAAPASTAIRANTAVEAAEQPVATGSAVAAIKPKAGDESLPDWSMQGSGELIARQKAEAEADENAAKASKPVARRVRVGVGGAQWIERAPKQSEAQQGSREPSRAAIIQALSQLTPRLRECVGEEHAIADVTLTVRAPGIVSHALVEGPYAGSEKGSCIARTLRSAKLPSFHEPLSRVEYPFAL